MSDETQIPITDGAEASQDAGSIPAENAKSAENAESGENADAAENADASEGHADGDLTEQVRTALRGVTDPELGINIVDLGLVYDIDVDDGAARVTMTLTSPGCPAGGQILGGAKDAAETVEGVEEAVVSLVWKPFWTPEKMDPKVRAMLGF